MVVVKASGDIRPWQKSRWEREKDKHEKAKAKLEALVRRWTTSRRWVAQ